ncbi:hypothetical protein GCM10009816_18050 [Microbacterium aquimaris]
MVPSGAPVAAGSGSGWHAARAIAARPMVAAVSSRRIRVGRVEVTIPPEVRGPRVRGTRTDSTQPGARSRDGAADVP